MPYFDPKPKTCKADLYNREVELSKLINFLKFSPLILILGLRRTGKTSLLYTALNESKMPNIIFDCRELPGNRVISLSGFFDVMAKCVNRFLRLRRRLARKFISMVEHIEGISVLGFSIKFKRSKGISSLVDVFDSLNELAEKENFRLIFAFDEAQELRRIAGFRVDRLLAYIYDNLRNIGIILTGSQIGLLYKFLRVNDPEAPLYGRARNEIFLSNFTVEQSIDFLIKGFKQYNVSPPMEFINEAVYRLNGVVGWPTLLGYKAISRRTFNSKLIDEVLIEAAQLARSEFEHFLALRWQARDRYLAIIRALVNLDRASWREIKRYLEFSLGGKIDDKNFTVLLKNLVDAGFVIKTAEGLYKLADPVLKYSFMKR